MGLTSGLAAWYVTRIWDFAGPPALELADDALFFTRYAENFWSHGTFSWNPGGPPTHGNTSQLYQLLVTAIYPFAGGDPVQTLVISASLASLLALMAIMRLVWEFGGAESKNQRSWLLAVVVAYYALNPNVAFHVGKGMDTPLALFAAAAAMREYLALNAGPATARRIVVASLCAPFLYLARPELGVFAVCAPTGIGLWHYDRRIKRSGWLVLVLGLAGIGLCLGVFALYYGSALPLPFFTKSVFDTWLEPHYREELGRASFTYLGAFALAHAIPVLICALGALFRGTWKNAVMRGLGVGTVFLVFHATFLTLPIMGFEGKYVYPCLAFFMLLGVRVYRASSITPASPLVRRVIFGLAVVLLLVDTPSRIKARLSRASDTNDVGALTNLYATEWASHSFRLLEFSREVPAECSIAAVEIGIVGALNPKRKVVDLAGLQEGIVAQNGFVSDWFFEEAQPDWLYVPSDAYRGMRERMLADPRFVLGYKLVDKRELKTKLSVAIRRDSVCFKEMDAILERGPG